MKPHMMDAKSLHCDRWTGQTREGADARKPHAAHVCVCECSGTKALSKNPLCCVSKNTSFSLSLVLHFYYLFLPITTLLTIVGYQSHCV